MSPAPAANITTPALSTTNISTSAIIANSITANALITGSLTMTSGLTIPYLSTINISTSIATAANLIATTRLTTPSLSTVQVFNGFSARPILNPGNILVYDSGAFTFGNGLTVKDINLTNFVPGVYECQAFCYNNPYRCLNATLFYYDTGHYQMYSANGFDNYNGCLWTSATVNLYPTARFQNQTDGPGDTFALFILMISGRTTAVGEDPPFPEPSTITISTATVNYGTPTPIIIGLSSMVGSTITMQATQNFSILANIPPPAYFSTGSITVAGTNQVNLLGNIVAIGGQTDVDIQANTNNVNIVANSTITLQGTPFDNFQGSIITSTPTYYVPNTQITNTSLVLLTPASPIDKPYWVSYNSGSNFCINVSSLATPTVMNYLVASYAGYGQQLSVSVVATGGTITTSGGYKIHTFTTSGTFTLTSPSGATIYYLVVGGGGGGGNFIAGGGGAGGLITGSTSFTATSYTITIGDGGAGNSTGANGTDGLNTTIVRNSDSSTIFDAVGGGGGGYLMGNGSSGGSGGGGGGLYSSSTSGGTATAGQGYGGAGSAYSFNHGGGGGGAGGAGSVGSAVNNNGGAGGPGLYVAAPLGATYYAGGGGGGSDAVGGGGGGAGTGGAGGAGGGGAGGSGLYLSPITGYNGTVNTGGGGGGGGNDGIGYGSGTAGGDGGSGIVILAYAYP